MASNGVNIHQFIAVLDEGDAMGNHALAIQDFVRSRGHDSEIFVWRAGSGMKGRCRDYHAYYSSSSPRNVLIYHFGVASPLTRFFLTAPDRKAIIYHNITPEHFFRGVNANVYCILKKGRTELRGIAGRTDLAMAVSEYNRRELEEAGFRNTVTVPLLIDFDRYKVAPDPSVTGAYKDGGTNVVFVGRLGPNKKQEDVIRAFSIYKKHIDPESRLFIIGQDRQVPEYRVVLEQLIRALDVRDVHLTGAVTQSELNAYYSVADLFLCMSEHEGFCIPLLESMHFGIPILAYDSSAIADTLRGSGVLFDEKDFARTAEMMNVIVSGGELKERIVQGQRERLKRFDRGNIEKELLAALGPLLN